MNNEASTAQEVHRVDTGKIYKDSEGNDCSIMQMIKREPFWAANRIQEGEDALAENEALHRKVEELETALIAIVECWDGPLYRHEMLPLITAARKALGSAKVQS